ncbi:MAG: CpaF family protein [Clostridia bacterium]
MRNKIVDILTRQVKSKKSNLDLNDSELERFISKTVNKYFQDNSIKEYNYIDKLRLEKNIFYSIRGLGIIDRILEMSNINEIMINGPKNIYYEKKGELIKFEDNLSSEKDLYDLIERIANNSAKAINVANPIMDTKLKDGSRVNVILPPLSLDGPTITIRVFNNKVVTIDQAIDNNTLSEEAAKFLERLVKAKYNIFISGGTSSGKTTLLNILSNFIPSSERIITIEDNAELQINNIRNLVRLEARAHTNKNLEVTIKDLIKTSLRMRPDRIIVGEVRGSEAIDMLQAMNTGHDGSLSTGHANSTFDMISRLEMMIMSGEQNYPLEFVQRQIASSIDIIIHMTKTKNKERRISEISEILNSKNNSINIKPLFVLKQRDNIKRLVCINRLSNTNKLERS